MAERQNAVKHSKDNTYNANDKELLPNCTKLIYSSYNFVLQNKCASTNYSTSSTSLTTNKENIIHSRTPLQAQQFHT
jgi:hypothetical protein